MSTNYYFKIKNSEAIKNEIKQLLKEEKLGYILGEKILNDKGWIFNDTIHIGRTASSWKPLFEKTEQYSSVREMIQFYENNRDSLIIIDEYGNEITFAQLKEIMIDNQKGKENMVIEDKNSIISEFFKTTIYEDEDGFQFDKTEFS